MKKTRPGVYMALGASGFELCHPVDKKDYERLAADLTGRPREANWKPIRMRLIHEDEGKSLAISDSPWLGSSSLIFRPSVIEALAPMLRDSGELLPLACEEAELVIYHPTRILAAIDEAASTIDRFEDGRIMMIWRHVFRSEVVGENDIFTIPMERATPTYLSHRFVDRWKEAGLKGLDFNQVWAAQQS